MTGGDRDIAHSGGETEMSTKRKNIAFVIDEGGEHQRKASNDHSSRRKASKEGGGGNTNNNNAKNQHGKRQVLLEYLHTEKQIVKKDPLAAIDDQERQLLDSLADQSIDFDKYFQVSNAPKAKDKLWKIPYTFTNEPTPEDQAPQAMDRFGQGVAEGMQVNLKVPSKVATNVVALPAKKKPKEWTDLLVEADDALDLYTQGPSVRARQRRGSVLQPRHVFLSPNPELDCGDKFVLSGLALPLRDWTSELVLDSWSQCPDESLLDETYKFNVCKDNSLPDHLDKLACADLKALGAGFAATANSPLSEAELKFYQSMRSHRRQSLVPPNFGGGQAGGDLRFRRQSYAGGGQLWSAKVEKNARNETYYQRVRLINPDFVPPTDHDDEDDDEDGDTSDEHENKKTVDIYLDYPELDHTNADQVQKFANELTLVVRQYFVGIRESEMINFIVHPGAHTLNECSNIKSLLHFHHRVIRLISTYIVHRETLSHAIGAMLFFINVARHLMWLGNWHSVHLVVQSLQCPPVVRLKDAWRKITFNHAEEYDHFIDISQQLGSDNADRLGRYENKAKCLVIFEDFLERIKEVCGLKLVQILQHRLHNNWASVKDDHIVSWISNEIDELLQEAGVRSTTSTEQKQLKKQSTKSLFKRIFSKKHKIKKNQKHESEEEEKEMPENEYNNNEDEHNFQKRLFSHQQSEKAKNTKAMPSCKRFWSVAEFNKLRPADRQPIQQEIIRTLVKFQKKAFYVFEERDERLKHFLLNSTCEPINTSMAKSRRIQAEKASAVTAISIEESFADAVQIKAEADTIEKVDDEPIEPKVPKGKTKRVAFA